MRPTDVIKQLVGEFGGWDQHDTLSFVFYDTTKEPGYPTASVDFEKGTVIFQELEADEDAEDANLREKTYAIKATLEPITEV